MIELSQTNIIFIVGMFSGVIISLSIFVLLTHIIDGEVVTIRKIMIKPLIQRYGTTAHIHTLKSIRDAGISVEEDDVVYKYYITYSEDFKPNRIGFNNADEGSMIISRILEETLARGKEKAFVDMMSNFHNNGNISVQLKSTTSQSN